MHLVPFNLLVVYDILGVQLNEAEHSIKSLLTHMLIIEVSQQKLPNSYADKVVMGI